jgi:hypothetical protein
MHVDHSALRVNQAGLIALVVLAFLLDAVAVLGFAAVVLGLAVISPRYGLFHQLYHQVLKPRGLVAPRVVQDDPAPHRFAAAVGASVLVASVLAMTAGGSPLIGWSLAAVVAVLAAINLFGGFCAGCFLYYQMARLRVNARRG